MRTLKALLAVIVMLSSAPAMAGWSWGLGYHNPPGATVGLNFMHLWRNWAFEAGIGYIGSSEDWDSDSKSDRDTVTYTVAGDMNFKYLFGSGRLRPFLQGGFGIGVSTTDSGSLSAGASLSRPFGGAGVYVMGQSAYMYASYLFLNAATLQVGIGFPF